MSTLLAEQRQQPLLEPEPGLLEDEEEKTREIEARLAGIEARLDEHEARFDAYNAALSLYEARVSSLEKLRAAATMIGAWKASTCTYQRDGVCTLWRISPEAAKTLGDIVVEKDGAPRINVAKAPWFCALCPHHRPRRGNTAQP